MANTYLNLFILYMAPFATTYSLDTDKIIQLQMMTEKHRYKGVGHTVTGKYKTYWTLASLKLTIKEKQLITLGNWTYISTNHPRIRQRT